MARNCNWLHLSERIEMLQSIKSQITTDSSGAATVFLTHGINSRPSGLLLLLKYDPGTIDTGADITITGETSGVPIMTLTNAGTSTRFIYPRAMMSEVETGEDGIVGTEIIPIRDERIKVVVASGGSEKTGTIEAILLGDSPY